MNYYLKVYEKRWRSVSIHETVDAARAEAVTLIARGEIRTCRIVSAFTDEIVATVTASEREGERHDVPWHPLEYGHNTPRMGDDDS